MDHIRRTCLFTVPNCVYRYACMRVWMDVYRLMCVCVCLLVTDCHVVARAWTTKVIVYNVHACTIFQRNWLGNEDNKNSTTNPFFSNCLILIRSDFGVWISMFLCVCVCVLVCMCGFHAKSVFLQLFYFVFLCLLCNSFLLYRYSHRSIHLRYKNSNKWLLLDWKAARLRRVKIMRDVS